MTIGALSFANPWILLALLGLPIIWLLLRNLPPAPKRFSFPAIRLLFDIKQDEQTPFRTPWWLLLLRTLIAAVIILALAEPRWNEADAADDGDVLVLIVDNGWTAAHAWQDRVRYLKEIADRAVRDRKEVVVLSTADGLETAANKAVFQSARVARESISSLVPRPWLPQRAEIRPSIEEIEQTLSAQSKRASVYWLSDGFEYDGQGDFLKELNTLGPLTVISPSKKETALALRPAKAGQNGLEIDVLRGHSVGTQEGHIRVFGEKGKLLAREAFALESGAALQTVNVKLPYELRAQVQQIEIENTSSAGAVTLLDERWQRKRVGLVTTGSREDVQPLLSDIYYIERALSPFADIAKASISSLLQEESISVLIVSDVGRFTDDIKGDLEEWVQAGGTLIRFAGPRLATHSDELVPVQLRLGNRTLDGSLSWSKPQKLSDFPANSPFAGLAAAEDVTVSRQVLAEPSLELPQKTWAQLTDGTPLVTATGLEEGLVVLFHVTANPNWSTLPLSGLFVEMLNRIVTTSQVPSTDDAAALAGPFQDSALALKPLLSLNGFGELVSPSLISTAVNQSELLETCPSPQCPPGYYGDPRSRIAINSVQSDFEMKTIESFPAGASVRGYQRSAAYVLGPVLLFAAMCLFLLDTLIALAFTGLTTRFSGVSKASSGAVVMALFLSATFVPEAAGQDIGDADEFAKRATLETALAYVRTGSADVDKMSYAGLSGLSRTLKDRTAVELGEPIGIDLATHELSFFPLIYWPVIGEQSPLPPEVSRKVDHYLKNGGTILFDTQDHQTNVQILSGGREGNGNLRLLLSSLDIPPLAPVSEDHVLTKAFYLLQDFPGRWSGGRLWVESTNTAGGNADGAINDGVSAVVIGSNDYAAAWAEDEMGRPLAAVVPGGDRQREWARRFGVNLVIYALTGNYKADQVHVPALLERLGQ